MSRCRFDKSLNVSGVHSAGILKGKPGCQCAVRGRQISRALKIVIKALKYKPTVIVVSGGRIGAT